MTGRIIAVRHLAVAISGNNIHRMAGQDHPIQGRKT
ncbi:hypothetical protein SAMN05421538_103254 [Paracoccus isoporae]|uniref:Uncharacterized protein n=1 Tax=Paracoccus isoporae TaxID=591205 RepID=A0A1G6ZH01_9RHOB|nr:hypothetical protein SAMN05421538_103254 [Paracoccus isoporae]